MKKGVSAQELMQKLNSDPLFVEAQRKRDEALAKKQSELAYSERPILLDLEKAGYSVESVWDFVNRANDYQTAVPILFAHLKSQYPSAIRDGLARALATPQSNFLISEFIQLLLVETDLRVRDSLAIAVSQAATFADLDLLLKLAHDRSIGASRILLLNGIERFAAQDADKILKSLRALREEADLGESIEQSIRRVEKKANQRSKKETNHE
jgi:hypothetical protein